MDKVVIYFSPTAGTKSVAELIAGRIDARAVDITVFTLAMDLQKDDLVFFCFPVYGGRIPSPIYERMNHIHGNETPIIPVAVFGNRAVDDALLEMSDLAEKNGFITVGGAEIIAPHSLNSKVAAGRPDASDKTKIFEYLDKLVAKDSFEKVTLPGNRPYVEYKGVPVYPAPNKKECIGCGICFNNCPAGAINEAQMKTDKSKCISCMRCVYLCSTDSRSVPLPMRLAAEATAKKMGAVRKEPKFY